MRRDRLSSPSAAPLLEILEPRLLLAAALSINDVAVDEGNSGTTPAVFTVTLSQAIVADATVNWATTDGTATVAGNDYVAASGILTIPAGQTTGIITVVVKGDTVPESDKTIFLNIDYAEGADIVDGQGRCVILDDDGVFLPFGGKTKAQFNDANHEQVTVQLTGPGSGQVHLSAPDGVDALGVVLNGTTALSSLTITTTGLGCKTTVGGIVVNGSLNALTAKTTDLLGGVVVTGSLKTLQLDDVAGGSTISIGGPAKPTDAVTIRFDQVSDLVIDSRTPISALTVTEWRDVNTPADAIRAPWLGRLTTTGRKADPKKGILALAGDFEADLVLDGAGKPRETLGTATIVGQLAGATWLITGAAGSIAAASTGTDWAANFTGSVAGLTVKGNAGGSLSAKSMGSIVIGGNLTGARIDVEGYLARLTVRDILNGAAVLAGGTANQKTTISAHDIGDGTTIDVASSIASLTAARVGGADFFAPSLGSLSIKGDKALGIPGDIAADVTLSGQGLATTGRTLGGATIKNQIIGGTWYVGGRAGAIAAGSTASAWKANFIGDVSGLTISGDLRGVLAARSFGAVVVKGNLDHTVLLAGADLGCDASLGGAGEAADTFGSGSILSLKVEGAAAAAVVGAGLNPADGVFQNADDAIVRAPGDSAVGGVSIGGQVGADCYFAAGKFPAIVTLQGAKADPALDARFFFGGLRIDALSTMDASPGALLTISGSGFDPAASTAVRFLDGDGRAWPVAPVVVQPTSLTCAVPPLFDVTTGVMTGGMVDVQIVQRTSKLTTNTRPLPGFRITDLPTHPMSAGWVTLAYFNAVAAAATEMQDAILATGLDTPAVRKALAQTSADAAKIAAAIQAVVNDPLKTFSLGKMGGRVITVGAAHLMNTDRLLLGVLGALADSGTMAPGAGGRLAGGADQPSESRALCAAEACTAASQGDPQLDGILKDILYPGQPMRDVASSIDKGLQVVLGAGGAAIGIGGLALLIAGVPATTVLAAAALPSAALLYVAVAMGGGQIGLGGALEQTTAGARQLVQQGMDMLEETMRAALAKGALSLIPHWGEIAIMGASAAAGAHSLQGAFSAADVSKGGIRVQPTSGLITDEDGATASFQVWLTLQPEADVVIDLATSDATEGQPSPSSLVFTPDDWNVPQMVTVTGLDDGVHDGTKSYKIIMRPAVSGDPAYKGLNPDDVNVTNLDKETVMYFGMFSENYEIWGYDAHGNYVKTASGTAGFRLTIWMRKLGTALGMSAYEITRVMCSDPWFGAQMAVPAVYPSVATLGDPPKNLSDSGEGFNIFFPNGANLGTVNGAGAMHMSSDGRTISNSLDPSIQPCTWVAVNCQPGPLWEEATIPGFLDGGIITHSSWIFTLSAL
jgi:hypothetical protein